MIRMVAFDVGETLVDETRNWSEWADFLGVPRFTFFAVFGALIAAGRHHREVFPAVSGFDYKRAVAARHETGWRHSIRSTDFYPDAIPCIEALRKQGIKVGVVGNQPAECEASLTRLGIKLDLLASSESWGIEKPSLKFFERLIAEAGLPAGQVCYVGDRADNDIVPARAAGLKTVFIKRGPWGHIHADSDAARLADLRIDSLSELPAALTGLGRD
jgi:HAD superfamily hydrolase (TIGR01662 family)